jgi:ribose-phosphate pyrophosphokinase
MNILDLTNQEESQLKYKLSKFPDGQQSITLEGDLRGNFSFLENKEVTLQSRLNTFMDLELIICATQALKESGIDMIHLYIPYCIGGRSDRKFMPGTSNYIKTVIAPVLNLQGYSSVKVLDPHSDVLEACINNFRKDDNIKLVGFALPKIDNTNEAREKTVIVSPDAGALKKIYNVAEHFEITKVLVAAKHRDIKSGKITHTEVPDLDKYRPDSNFVIIDDICDGGRTFTEISKVIKAHVWPRDEYFRGKIFLIVTHGIFSAGLSALDDYFDGIYTTNSYKDVSDDPDDTDNERKAKQKVKQLNIF